MAYSELIKDFNRIRSYMREFYVYGFRHRSEFDAKSARSYDNERRRIESWLGDFMTFGQDPEGRRFFLSVDSRSAAQNPLYRAFKTKSFTDRDIMLHFMLLDILSVYPEGLPIMAVMEELSELLYDFEDADIPDESTVRKKLSEYEKLGILRKEKRGRESFYLKNRDDLDLRCWHQALSFYSEVFPLGIIGSFMMDRLPENPSPFRFKHHYMINALDSEIMEVLIQGIMTEHYVLIQSGKRLMTVFPIRIYISSQSGRQYLLAASSKKILFFIRIDKMDAVRLLSKNAKEKTAAEDLTAFQSHLWGISANAHRKTDWIKMTVYAGADEAFIPQRLNREKSCGTVTQIDDTHWRFEAEIYDVLEMLPWIRTFTGRITDLKSSNALFLSRYQEDLKAMAAFYGGGEDALS